MGLVLRPTTPPTLPLLPAGWRAQAAFVWQLWEVSQSGQCSATQCFESPRSSTEFIHFPDNFPIGPLTTRRGAQGRGDAERRKRASDFGIARESATCRSDPSAPSNPRACGGERTHSGGDMQTTPFRTMTAQILLCSGTSRAEGTRSWQLRSQASWPQKRPRMCSTGRGLGRRWSTGYRLAC